MKLYGSRAACGYYLWLRSRWPLALIALAILAGVMVRAAWPLAEWLPFAGFIAGAVVMFAWAVLVGVFTHGGGDLGAAESTFPRHMLSLPARSQELAGAPMLGGLAASICIWALLAKFIVNPMFLQRVGAPPISIGWPAMMLASVLAWLQVTSWTQFWFPYVRVAATLGILAGLVAWGVGGRTFGVPDAVLVASYTTAILFTFPLAVRGVARTRRGDGAQPSWRTSESVAACAPRAARRPFSSPMSAQVWLELRRNVLMVPALSAGVPLLLIIITLLGSKDPLPIVIAGVGVTPFAMVAVMVFGAPVFAAGMHGPMLGKSDAWTKGLGISSFIAIRPLGTAQLIAAKLRAAAIAAGVSWAIVIGSVAIWSVFPNVVRQGQSIAGLVAEHGSARNVSIALTVLAALVFISWKQMAQSLYISMYGRSWFAQGMPLLGMLLLGSFMSFGLWIAKNEHARQVVATIAPWALSTIVAVRVALGAWILSWARRASLLSSRQTSFIAIGWIVSVGVIFAGLLWALLPGVSPAILLCIAAFFPPGVRTLAALPALFTSRHR